MDRINNRILKLMVHYGMAIDISKEDYDYLDKAERGMGYDRICKSVNGNEELNGCLLKGRYTGKFYAVIGKNALLLRVF